MRVSSASVIRVHLCCSDNGMCVLVCIKINMLHLAGEPVCHSCASVLNLTTECVDPSLFQNETKCRGKSILSCWNWRNFKELQEKGVQGVGQGACAAGEEMARKACAECISESSNMV